MTLNKFVDYWMNNDVLVSMFQQENPELKPGTDEYFEKMIQQAEKDYEVYKAECQEADFLAVNF